MHTSNKRANKPNKAIIGIRKTDWKTKPLPKEIEALGYEGFFYDSDAERIIAGHKPEDMDDKWFIYSEDDWVYFVRSWTGHHIYGIRLHPTAAGGCNVTDSWVNKNIDEYHSPGREMDIQIINGLFLSRFQVEVQA